MSKQSCDAVKSHCLVVIFVQGLIIDGAQLSIDNNKLFRDIGK